MMCVELLSKLSAKKNKHVVKWPFEVSLSASCILELLIIAKIPKTKTKDAKRPVLSLISFVALKHKYINKTPNAIFNKLQSK